MKLTTILAAMLLAAGLAGCSSAPRFKSYNGPEVTRLYLNKGDRRLYLLHDREVLKAYDVDLGFAPDGNKVQEGDGRTPEGNYVIDRRNPRSDFHLSLGISYPNKEDVARAKEQGVKPGGDIFIHGRPNGNFLGRRDGPDWTAGCISVKNREIEDIYAMVPDGTPVTITP